ncbi:MAG TPA: hypothetical protein VK165_06955 [Azonexus sp.]|nr:hypothetical protein [Azonexus sp.]
MSERPALPADFLDQAGLNRQHVFDLAALPADLAGRLAIQGGERQLILIGHGGRRLWECVQASGLGGEHPIDNYSTQTVERWFAACLPGHRYRILYPGEQPIGLQALGELAGWHQPSPIMVGVDRQWGSWYAYRAVVLADTDLQPSVAQSGRSPCLDCPGQPCIAACPAGALRNGRFNLETCSRFRLQPESPCAHGCLARQACPVGSEHRYEPAQIEHSYSRSLAAIRQYFR